MIEGRNISIFVFSIDAIMCVLQQFLLTVQGGGSDVVSVACFVVRVSVMFHLVFVHYTFYSVWLAE